MVLEKGLRIYGSSRSGREDFLNTAKMLEEHPEIVDYFTNIVSEVLEVKNIIDMKNAFETDIRKSYGKTIMLWNV